MLSIQALKNFPSTGSHSIAGFTAPSNTGTVLQTEIRNLLDTRWASTAINRASASVTNPLSATCFSSSGIVNAGANGFGLISHAALDLAGLGNVLITGIDSLRGTIGDFSLAATLQSLTAGMARTISNMASAAGQLIESAMSNVGAVADKLLGMASRLVEAASDATAMFGDAFQMATRGLIGINGEFDPGALFSGAVDKLAALTGSAIAGGLNAVGSLLNADLRNFGFNITLPPNLGIDQLAKLFPINAISSALKGISNALSKLNSDMLDKVASKLGEAVSFSLGKIDSMISSIASKITAIRLQGTSLIDGKGWRELSKIISSEAIFSALKSGLGTNLLAVMGSSVNSAIKLASALGLLAPIRGSFLSSDISSWIGSPSAALKGISGALAESCAFNAALYAAINQIKSGAADHFSIDALLASLECRRSTYSKVATFASKTTNDSRNLLNNLNALLAVMQGGVYPSICAASGILGRC